MRRVEGFRDAGGDGYLYVKLNTTRTITYHYEYTRAVPHAHVTRQLISRRGFIGQS